MSAISGPNGSNGLMDPFRQFSDQVQELADLIPGVDSDDIQEVSKEIQDLPVDKRFTESRSILMERVASQLEDLEDTSTIEDRLELFEGLFPLFLEQLEGKLEEGRNETLEIVVENREEAQGALIVAMYFDVLSDTIDALRQQSLSGDVNETVMSILLALNSRLFDFQRDDAEPAAEDLSEDVLYANYYLAKERKKVTPTHPSELSERRMIQQVLAAGAVKAYQELEISLSRGAELAEMSLDEFEATLSQNDIQPQQGPDDDEKLYAESEDWF